MPQQTAPFAPALPVGSRLDNGATVLRSTLRETRSGVATYFVLALAHGTEFVTWTVAASAATGETDAYWGHYFGADLPAALADFDRRTA